MALVLHASDLHLDAPCLSSPGAPEWVADLLRDATLHSFDRLVSLAESRTVDLCLFAGDVHHDGRPSLRARLAWRDGLERLHAAGIPAMVVRGNHDHLGSEQSRQRLPPSVVVFPAGHATTSRLQLGADRVAVTGISFGRRHETARLALAVRAAAGERGTREHPADEWFRIGLLHSNLEGVDRHCAHGDYAPSTVHDLEAGPIDYWALGHVHTCAIRRLRGCWAVYPGCLQGRTHARQETGPKGAVIFDVHGASLAAPPEPVETAVVRYEETRLDVSGLRDDLELADALTALVEDTSARSSAATLLRVVLSGYRHPGLPAPGALGEIREACHRPGRVWIGTFEDRTDTPADPPGTGRTDTLLAAALARLDRLDPGGLLTELPVGALDAPPPGWHELASDGARRRLAELLGARRLSETASGQGGR